MFAVPSAQAEQGGLTAKTSANNKKRVPISWNSLEKKWRWPTLPLMFAVPSAQAEQGGLTAKTSANNKKKRVPISWNSLEKKWRWPTLPQTERSEVRWCRQHKVARSMDGVHARAGCEKTAPPGEKGIDTCICKKTSPFGTRLFIKSGDDLLSHKCLQYHRPKPNKGD